MISHKRENTEQGHDIHVVVLTIYNQYLGRDFHGSVRWGGDYADDWNHGGQWLRHRRRRRRRGNNRRHHPNREGQRRRWGSHNRCRHGNGKGWRRRRVRHSRGRRSYTGLRRGARARKRRRKRQKGKLKREEESKWGKKMGKNWEKEIRKVTGRMREVSCGPLYTDRLANYSQSLWWWCSESRMVLTSTVSSRIRWLNMNVPWYRGDKRSVSLRVFHYLHNKSLYNRER